MVRLRTWIIDDEELARDRLRRLLGGCLEVELTGEFRSAADALAEVQQAQPDVVFLDIEMPGLNGLAFAALLQSGSRPAIVFVTAHESFAVAAFGVEAVDYLLKPFDSTRLRQAVARARDWVCQRRLHAGGASTAATAVNSNQDRLAVRADGRVVVLRLAEIEWIEAANNYVMLHLGSGKRLMMRTTLSALEQRLPSPPFIRVNRSAVANANYIDVIRPANYGDHEILLRGGAVLWISRARRGELMRTVKIDSGPRQS